MKKVIIIAAIVMVALGGCVFAAWKILFNPMNSVKVTEYFEGITWNMDGDDVDARLRSDGYNSAGSGITVYLTEKFSGLDDVVVKVVPYYNEEEKVESVMLMFSEGESELATSKKHIKKLVKKYTKEFDKLADKTLTKKDIITDEDEEGIGDFDVYNYYFTENSMITVKYIKGEYLYVIYNDINSEEAQEIYNSFCK